MRAVVTWYVNDKFVVLVMMEGGRFGAFWGFVADVQAGAWLVRQNQLSETGHCESTIAPLKL